MLTPFTDRIGDSCDGGVHRDLLGGRGALVGAPSTQRRCSRRRRFPGSTTTTLLFGVLVLLARRGGKLASCSSRVFAIAGDLAGRLGGAVSAKRSKRICAVRLSTRSSSSGIDCAGARPGVPTRRPFASSSCRHWGRARVCSAPYLACDRPQARTDSSSRSRRCARPSASGTVSRPTPATRRLDGGRGSDAPRRARTPAGRPRVPG